MNAAFRAKALSLLVLMGAAVLAASCSSGGSKLAATVSPTSTSAAVAETPFPTPTIDTKAPPDTLPTPVYPAARPQPSDADRASLTTDPLVVFADEVASSSFNGRRWPVIEVVSYNLRTHRIAGLFRVGAIGEFAYVSQVELAGRRAVISLERRVVIANLDGAGLHTLFQPPDGAVVNSIGVSPDGRTLAVGTESRDFIPGPLAFLALIDIDSGKEEQRIGLDRFRHAGLYGTPGVVGWVDNRRVEVFGVQHKGGGGFPPTAVAGIDGVVTLRPQPVPNASTDEKAVAAFSGELLYGCQGSWQLPRAIEVRDTQSGSTIGVIAEEGYAVDFNRWSPDGKSILLATHQIRSGDRPGSICFEVETVGAWRVWSSGSIADVPDLRALLQTWYGSRFVDLECAGKPIDMVYPLNSHYLRCNNFLETPPAALLVGGEKVGVIHEAAIAGFIGP